MARSFTRENVRRRNRADDQLLRIALAATLSIDSTAIDIGAHRGRIFRELRRIAPRGKHIAFEPLPEAAANLRSAFPGADIRETALWNSSGRSPFVHVVDDPAFSGVRERSYPEHVQQLQTITVRTALLDDEVGDVAPAFLKIDVEGAELQVLQGAAETLVRARPVVWFEHGRGGAPHYGTTPGAVWDLLADIGMRIFDANAHGPLSRDEFEDSFARGMVWNYLAHS